MSVASRSMMLWQRLHWAFFVNTQGLFVCLSRFEQALTEENYDKASAELHSAAVIMRASGASMKLAGSFNAQEYESTVRPSMMKPSVGIDDFSGLLSWDHACLIQLWRRLSKLFADLPDALHEAHDEFIDAYSLLATSHGAVCAKFGGETDGSIRFDGKPAVEVLKNFDRSRRGMLDPSGRAAGRGCPMDLKS